MEKKIQIINFNQSEWPILTEAEIQQIETDIELVLTASDAGELIHALQLAGHFKTELEIHCRINQEPLERFFKVFIMYNFGVETATWHVIEEYKDLSTYLEDIKIITT